MARGGEASPALPFVVWDKDFAKIMFKALIEKITKYKGTIAPTFYEFTTVIKRVVSLTIRLTDGKIRLAKSKLKGPTQIFVRNDQSFQNCQSWEFHKTYNQTILEQANELRFVEWAWICCLQRQNENIQDFTGKLMQLAKRTAPAPRNEADDKKAAREVKTWRSENTIMEGRPASAGAT
jgi:hypothetical protein